MTTMLVLIVLSADLRPVDLGAPSLERARALDGKAVTATLLAKKPSYTLPNRTVGVGAAERDDDVERGAVLLGRRPPPSGASSFSRILICWA